MVTSARNRQTFPLWVLLLATMLGSAAPRHADSAPADGALAGDLRTVIVLAGYRCNGVVEYSQPNQSDYDVSCEQNRRYLVRISKENELVVENRSIPSEAMPQSGTEHETFMKRQLSAIVNLAGHDCAGIVSFERQGPKDNIVTCEDLTVYRIHVTPAGRVAVEKQSIEK